MTSVEVVTRVLRTSLMLLEYLLTQLYGTVGRQRGGFMATGNELRQLVLFNSWFGPTLRVAISKAYKFIWIIAFKLFWGEKSEGAGSLILYSLAPMNFFSR